MENKILTDYLSYATEFCDAPNIFHQATLYSITGTLTGRKRWYNYGDLKIFPNMWVILLAPSSLYRKSTSINIGIRLMNRVKPSLIYPSEFSHEKLIEILQGQPTGTFVFFEFLTFLGQLERDYLRGTKGLLTELFDAPDFYQRKTKTADILIENSAINIVSATTMAWLKNVNEMDLLGGFLPRFLFIPATSKYQSIALPIEADIVKQNGLISHLHRLTVIEPKKLIFSEEAKKEYIRYYHKLELNITNMKYQKASTLLNRSSIYLLKLAIIIQTLIDPESNEITIEVLQEGIKFLNTCIIDIENLFGELTFNKTETHILRISNLIKQAPDGISKSKLLTSSGMLSKELNAILDTLMESNKIEKLDIKTSTKPTVIYKINSLVD